MQPFAEVHLSIGFAKPQTAMHRVTRDAFKASVERELAAPIAYSPLFGASNQRAGAAPARGPSA
jgi:hypothetical protein